MKYQQNGQLDVAAKFYKLFLSAAPNQTDALNNLGVCLIELDRPYEAISILSDALEHNALDPELLNNLGNALQKSMQIEEAVAKFELALKIQPNNVTILLNLSKNLLRLGDYYKALEHLKKARNLDPTNLGVALVDSLALPVVYKSQEEIVTVRKRLESKLDEMECRTWKILDPIATVGQTNYFLAYQGSNDKEIQKRIAEIYLKSCPDLGFVADHCVSNQKIKKKRVKIGFVSTYLGNHTIGKLFRGLIKGLDLKKFEIILFHLGSDRRAKDEDLDALSSYVDDFALVPSQYSKGREIIANYEVDILYYMDIGMEPLGYFLAFSRLAPIQCVTWGHPVTTGIPNIDYFISWKINEPHDAKSHYSEELILFKGFSTYYSPPDYESLEYDRGQFGLNADENLYVCPQSLFKFHPSFDPILVDILCSDDRARIIILDGQQKHWGQLLKNRFSLFDPALTNRITILPRLGGTDYLRLMKLADVILDTPVFCGGNSTLEALAAGKIVVTLPGNFMRGRLTSGIYIQLGLEDLIPNSPEAYVKLAVLLATDANERAKQAWRIKKRWPLIFNNTDTIQSHEKFFMKALAEAKNQY